MCPQHGEKQALVFKVLSVGGNFMFMRQHYIMYTFLENSKVNIMSPKYWLLWRAGSSSFIYFACRVN